MITTFSFGLIFCLIVMTLAWAVSARLNFYSLVDAVWAYGIGAVVILYAFNLEGASSKKALAIILALFWSIRLGTYLALRLKAHYPTEDIRYVELKRTWGRKQFLLFFQFQGVSQVLFSLPFLSLSADVDPNFSAMNYVGPVIFLIGLLGESVADKQLSRFRQNTENRGKVCDVGLWKYSRHPNYFFEWIAWCGIALTGLSGPYGYIGLLSPALMYLTLNYFTGIPATEAQSLKSKGDLYKEYQSKTNRFFPGFRT